MNSFQYRISVRSGSRPLVTIDNFEVTPNRVMFLFGESGIGKSVICKSIYGLLDPEELTVSINNTNYFDYCRHPWTTAIRSNSFFVFQEPSSHLNSLMTIEDQLREGSLGSAGDERRVLDEFWSEGSDSKLREILSVYPKPYRPSGGEKQRILLAMAFKKIGLHLSLKDPERPTFFVFDEPTGSLDNAHRNLFLRLLFEKFSMLQFTAVVITHDYSIISEIYAKYRSLIPYIQFKELSRVGESATELNDFSAQEYLGWLDTTRGLSRDGTQGEPVIRMDSSFSIFGRSLRIFKDPRHTIPTDLVIHRGETVYVKAPSGVGKTTLAKIIMGLYEAKQVMLIFDKWKFTEQTPKTFWSSKIWGKKGSMVFQHADESLDLESTVYETFKGLPLKSTAGRNDIAELLSQFFDRQTITPGFLRKKVKFLSGGQKQRLNLLRTLALGTDLIIFDEPLNALDFQSVKRVLDQIEKRRFEGAALLMISHNEEIFDALVGPEHVYYLAQVGN